MFNKRQRYGWYLFDFANSVLIINGGLYFPQWIVVDRGLSVLYFNLMITFVSLLLITTAPILGMIADRKVGYVVFLRLISAAMFIAAAALGVLTYVESDALLIVFLALAAFFVIMYGYQLSLVFYNAMLGRLATSETYSKVSGLGLAYGWLGGVFGIVAIFPFVQGFVPYFQAAGREQAFLPAAVLFGLLILFSLYLIRDDRPTIAPTGRKSILGLYAEFYREVKTILHNKALIYFLVCYIFFAEAVLTIQNNSTLYLDVVMRYEDNVKALLFLLLLVMAAVGGVASGYGAFRYGIKRCLSVTLTAWVVVLLLVSVTSNQLLFVILFGVIGVLFGSLWNLSRVLFMLLIPSRKRGGYFGLYSSFERFTSLLGPVLWSAPVMLLGAPGGYRVAIIEMAALLFVSLVVLVRIQIPNAAGKATNDNNSCEPVP